MRWMDMKRLVMEREIERDGERKVDIRKKMEKDTNKYKLLS